MKIDKNSLSIISSDKPSSQSDIVRCCNFNIIRIQSVLGWMDVAVRVVLGRMSSVRNIFINEMVPGM